jgi:hypothetical protein
VTFPVGRRAASLDQAQAGLKIVGAAAVLPKLPAKTNLRDDGVAKMPMTTAMYDSAANLVRGLDTENVGTFGKALADAGLACVAGGDSEGIEWWTASTVQKNDLLKLVKAGSKQTECKNLLSDYTLNVPASASVSQPFVTAEFDRSGWFQYYYSEAAAVKHKLKSDEARMLDTITNVFFLKQSKSGPGGTFAQKVTYDSVNEDLFRQILFELMSTGFERIPATCQQAIAGNTSDSNIMGKMLWAGNAQDVEGTDVKVIKVKAKWRADSRKYSDIQAANGFVTKAHSDGYAKSTNLSAKWHPLSTDLGGRFLWFRKSQKDNCLYSVVSVGKAGKEWRTYLPYPLIKLSGGKVTGLRGYLGTKKVKCVPAAGGAPVDLDLPTSETYLYSRDSRSIPVRCRGKRIIRRWVLARFRSRMCSAPCA